MQFEDEEVTTPKTTPKSNAALEDDNVVRATTSSFDVDFGDEATMTKGDGETITTEVRQNSENEPRPAIVPQFRYLKAIQPPRSTPKQLDEETVMEARIVHLWSEQKRKNATAKRTREELSRLRTDLGQELYGLKLQLAKTGRNGEWNSFLRSHGIPRSTADRCVERHKLRLEPERVNCPTEAISLPTTAVLSQLVAKLKPTLLRLLTTEDLKSQFLNQIQAVLNQGATVGSQSDPRPSTVSAPVEMSKAV
jgi:hypothetical protein